MTDEQESPMTNTVTPSVMPNGSAGDDIDNGVVEQLIKSRERVKAHGEVFTPRHMVEQMLDLVADDLKDVDKTFFEPAAGDGNFLLVILQRKLQAIKNSRRPSNRRENWPAQALFALASIYAVELLADNHAAAKEGLLQVFTVFCQANGIPCGQRTNLWQAARFIIDVNIVQGNTLTGKRADGDDIEFSWWNRVADSPTMVQREPFTLNSLRDQGAFDFTEYASYAPCRIDHVHKEVRADD